MKAHTSNFKTNIAKLGRQFDAILSYTNESVETTIGGEHIYYITPSCETELFVSIMPMIEFEIDSQISINTKINFKYGILVDSAYEYIDYGDYTIIEEPIYNADTTTYTYKAYKKMYESMISYDKSVLNIEYPITLKNYIIAICDRLNWNYILDDSFPNEDTEITSDLYYELGMTYRDVLDDICPATMGNFIFDDDENFIIKYPTETGDTIDDEYLKDISVNFGETYGVVNSLVLSRAEEGDSIYRSDESSISTNGLTELKISDNLLLSSDIRENFIQEMFDYINGFSYDTCDFVSTGICYYDVLDRFTVNHDGVDYSIILLNNIQNIGQGLTENIYLDMPSIGQTDYSASSFTDKGIKNAIILANKQTQEIKLLTYAVEENTTKTTQFTEDIEGININISEIDTSIDNNSSSILNLEASVEGLDLQISKTGGSNIFSNPVGYFYVTSTLVASDWVGDAIAYTDTEIKKYINFRKCFFIKR